MLTPTAILVERSTSVLQIISLCSYTEHSTFRYPDIITDSYEFEYGPAENDPEFGVAQDEGAEGGKAQDIEHGGGRWVHKITGTKLGDADGHLEFTVVGYVSVYSTTS